MREVPVLPDPCEIPAFPEVPAPPAGPTLTAAEMEQQAVFYEALEEREERIKACPYVRVR